MKDLRKLIICIVFCISPIGVLADPSTINFLLNELRRNYNGEVQSEIVKTLGSYSQETDVQNSLGDLVQDPRSNPKVRAQAAFSLSAHTTNLNILNTILTAHDRSTDIWLRSKFLEAIYPAVASNHKVMSVLKNNLIQNHSPLIQQASAFSLGKNISDPQIKNFLLERVENPFLDEIVKIEIIKSFYTELADQNIRATIERIALSPQFPEYLRSAATRVMATAPKSRSSRQALFDLLSHSNSQQIRLQAAAGLKFELTEEDVQWMRLTKDPRSGLLRNAFSRL